MICLTKRIWCPNVGCPFAVHEGTTTTNIISNNEAGTFTFTMADNTPKECPLMEVNDK